MTRKRTATRSAQLLAGGRSRRWASAAVLVVVVAVCGLSLISVHRLSGAATSARATTTLSDLYQDARYFAASATGKYQEYRTSVYRGSPQPSLRDAERALLDQLSATLVALDAATGSDATAIRTLAADAALYAAATARVEDVLAGGRSGPAREALLAADDTLAQDARTALTVDLGSLEENSQGASQQHLASAAAQASLLSRGTPAVLAASVLLAFLLGGVLRRQRSIEALASTDALTQLPNRLALTRRAADVLARDVRKDLQPCLLLLDLDRFKEVNDSLGHHYGDELLVQVSERVRAAVEGADLVARLGGDEFAILLGGGGEKAGRHAAAQVEAALGAPFLLNGLSVEVDVSIGIAVATTAADDLSALLRCADVAMYVAKGTSEGFVVYTVDHDVNTSDKVRLMSELRHALTADELVVHYQPKVALGDSRLLGVEALVRWQHPARGLLQPADFLPLVEGSELMDRLTWDVLTKALHQVKNWAEQGLQVPVAVNIPTRSLLNATFPSQVAALLAGAGVDPGLLSLEITESSAMHDPQRCIEVLKALRLTGIRVSIDDYGTGYASMSYLKDLPVDELKIDRAFVSGVLNDPQTEILARSIIELGHNLGLTVVGEGVEDESVAALLRDAGCDVAQGFLYARPMSGPDLALWATDEQRPGTSSRLREWTALGRKQVL